MQFIVPDTSAAAEDHDDDDDDGQQTPTAHIPIDWGLKTKLRLLTLSRLTGNGLKSCQEASGITSFVRCLTAQTASDGLDISLGARFHQATMYWQHPHVPWLTLFPRTMRANADFTCGEAERAALAKDWTESFRALFQLLRARQCAYFYVCANSYNVLFCAAGVGGRDEQHAYLTPTSRGMRAALKQEEIEFTMPLKEVPGATAQSRDKSNKSLDSGVDTQSTSFSNGSDECTQPDERLKGAEADNSSDEDQDEWLASLGVEAAEIRKIGSVDARVLRNNECAEDFSDHSIALIEGVECQAFFNFLLNSKSTITKTGRLAGVPPTLLAPVAFPGATLRSVQTRASQIRMDGVEYHSLELKGVVLPHVLQYLSGLMRESKDTFSASLTGHAGTNAFSKAAQRLMEGEWLDSFCFPAGCFRVPGRLNTMFLNLKSTHLMPIFPFQTNTARRPQVNRRRLAIRFSAVRTCPTVACRPRFCRPCAAVHRTRCAVWSACASTRMWVVTRGIELNISTIQ